MSGLLQPTSGSNQPTPDFGRAFSKRINMDRFVDGGHIKTHSYRRIRWNCLLAQGLLESWTAGCGFNDMDPVERHVSSYESLARKCIPSRYGPGHRFAPFGAGGGAALG